MANLQEVWRFFKREKNLNRCIVEGCHFVSTSQYPVDLFVHLSRHKDEFKEFQRLTNGNSPEISDKNEDRHTLTPPANLNRSNHSLQVDESLEYVPVPSPIKSSERPRNSLQNGTLPFKKTIQVNLIDSDDNEPFIKVPLKSTLNIVQKSKHELTQKGLETEIGLFMSVANLPNSLQNFYFRNFLSHFQPNYKLPSLRTKAVKTLDADYLEIVHRMKLLFSSVTKFTLMVNALKLEVSDYAVISISIAFRTLQELKVLLLSIDVFDPKKSINVSTLIANSLVKYNLNEQRIVRTMFGGFSSIGLNSNNAMIPHHFECQFSIQLLNVLNQALNTSILWSHLKSVVLKMVKSFASNEMAREKFEEVCEFSLISDRISYDKLFWILFNYRAQFLNICSNFTDYKPITMICDNDWKILNVIYNLKSLFVNQARVFKDGVYITIDQVIPRLNQLLLLLRQDFSSLGPLSVQLESLIQQQFAYILDYKNDHFDPIYVQSTFLNPQLCSSLNEEQMSFAKISLEKMVIERFNRFKNVNNLSNSIEDRKFIEFTSLNSKKFIQTYYESVLRQIINVNAFDYWFLNSDKFDELAQIALEFLTIPMAATLPIDLSSPNLDKERSFEKEFSANDPFYFITKAENLEDLERNAIIRLNNLSDTSFLTINHSPITPIEREKPTINEGYKLAKVLEDPQFMEQKSRIRSVTPPIRRKRSRSRPPVESSRPPKIKRSSRIKSTLPSPVLMIYNVSGLEFFPDRLFNLFSNYGNVSKIKYLPQNRSTCVVQMFSKEDAENVIRYLDNIRVFDSKILIKPSLRLMEVWCKDDDYTLKNGRSSFEQYSKKSKFNFSNLMCEDDLAYPCRELLFSGVPLNFTKSEIMKVFSSKDVAGPKEIIQNEAGSSNSLSGVMIFESTLDASTFLMVNNHFTISESYILKLKFGKPSKKR